MNARNFITTATNNYNILGELVSTKDGNGNQTQFDYTDVWNDTCLTTPVFAYPTTATNALNQETKNVYNSCDGSLASTTDQNDITAGRSGTVYMRGNSGTRYLFSYSFCVNLHGWPARRVL